MIEFKGKMSKKGKWLIKRIQTFPIFFVCPLAVIFVAMPIMGIMIFGSDFSIEKLPTMAFSYGVGVILMFIFCLLINNKNDIPLCIEIVKGKTIKSKCRKKTYVHSIQEVRKVIDYGNFYSIRINKQFEHGHFLCQKDLLTKGSIEEFEKIFKGKIIRKGKAKQYENWILWDSDSILQKETKKCLCSFLRSLYCNCFIINCCGNNQCF